MQSNEVKSDISTMANATHNHDQDYAQIIHTHTASQVTQDSNNRFVTDVEKKYMKIVRR